MRKKAIISSNELERENSLYKISQLKEQLSALNHCDKFISLENQKSNISENSIDYLFGLAYLHDTNYEEYLFLEKYIENSLKERIVQLKKELVIISETRDKFLEALGSPDANIRNIKHSLESMNFREKDIYAQIEKIEEALQAHVIHPKGKPFFKEKEQQERLKKWLAIKRAQLAFYDNKWHLTCNGDLPKDSNEVILATDQNQVFAGYYNGAEWYSADDFLLGRCCKVLAWHDMLEPPLGLLTGFASVESKALKTESQERNDD